MLNIYKASAGSGKTYTLVNEYIKLALNKNFADILAVTFTNNAASEMKNRIIDELYQMAINNKESGLLKSFSENYKNIDERSKLLLSKILHNYSDFQISTIDSFVQRVIRAFTFELGINSSYTLELDQSYIIKQITDELFLEIDDNKTLQNWLTDYTFDKIDDAAGWNVRSSIESFANELFKENFYNLSENLNSSENESFLNKIENLRSFCYGVKNNSEKEFKEFQERAKEHIRQNFANLDGAIFGYYEKIFNSAPGKPEINKTVEKTLEYEFPKNQAKNIDLLRNFVDLFLKPFIKFTEKNAANYIAAKKLLNSLYNLGLIVELRTILNNYRSENNVLFILDLTVLLKKLIGDTDAPFIYEKIGSKLQNFMIDEFQDTSDFQWFNFRPLIQNSLASGNNNLIVGDVKQAIYRWRNGNWELLHKQIKQDFNVSQYKELNLDTNYRSLPNIISFNNILFGKDALPTLMAKKVSAENAELNSLFMDVYSDSAQKPKPNAKNGGFVHFEFINDEFSNESIKRFTELIEDLLGLKNNQPKFLPGDIGVLTRKNDESNKIVNTLLEINANSDRKFNIISEESLLISNSKAVKILLNSLKFIHLFHKTRKKTNTKGGSYLPHLIEIVNDFKLLKNLKYDIHIAAKIKSINDIKGLIPDDFVALTDKFLNYGLIELIEKLISIFKLNELDENGKNDEIPFIRSFQEQITDYVSSKSPSIVGFLDYWENKGNKATVKLSEVKDAIEVLTIHKSKGLAYKVVIMPFINWKYELKPNSLEWFKTKNTLFEKFIDFVPLEVSKNLEETDFSVQFQEKSVLSFLDNLNLIYVAFTRAKSAIYGFAQISKTGNENQMGALLHSTIIENETLKQYLINNTNFNFGEEPQIITSSEKSTDENSRLNIDEFKYSEYPAHDWTDNIAIISHAQDFIAEAMENRRVAIKKGIIIHEILENTFELSKMQEIANEKALKYELSAQEIKDILQHLKFLEQNETFTSWFDQKWEVYAEREILTSSGDIFIPDRVIKNNEKIIVIDYKSGAKRREHKNQLKYYYELLRNIYPDKQIEGYLLYITENEISKIEF